MWKRLGFIGVLIGALVIASGTASAGIVAYYTFNDSSNLGADSSGNGYTLDGTWGTPAYTAAGYSGGGLHLDGSSFLYASNFPALVPLGNSAFSITLFFQTTSFPQDGAFIKWSNGEEFELHHDVFSPSLGIANLGYQGWNDPFFLWPPNSGSSIVDGNWHFAAFTWDPTTGTRTIYYDSTSVSQSGIGPANMQNWGFMVGYGGGGSFFEGTLDNIAVYDQALPPAQIGGIEGLAPEPSSFFLLGGALGLLTFLRRR